MDSGAIKVSVMENTKIMRNTIMILGVRELKFGRGIQSEFEQGRENDF